jgi:hypothetical protein
MNSVLISTNNGKHYRITVRVEQPGMNIESVWDDINSVVMSDKQWLLVLGGDDIVITDMMSAVNISAVTLNIKNISSIELFKEDKKNGEFHF